MTDPSIAVARLFVYGSLQPGAANAHVLAPLGGNWEPAVVRGRLEQTGWGAAIGFPGLVLDESAEDVAGQVLSSPGLADKWDELDAFEGSEYERVIVPVARARGDVVDAFVYVLRGG